MRSRQSGILDAKIFETHSIGTEWNEFHNIHLDGHFQFDAKNIYTFRITA